jgi:hypothetical protein
MNTTFLELMKELFQEYKVEVSERAPFFATDCEVVQIKAMTKQYLSCSMYFKNGLVSFPFDINDLCLSHPESLEKIKKIVFKRIKHNEKHRRNNKNCK